MQYIEIEKDMIPYAFEIMLGQEMFVFEVMYNERINIFTASLYDSENNPLVYGEPMIYGQELFASVRDLKFPIVRIVPIDTSGKESEITFENMNKTVLLSVNYESEEVS